MVIEVASPPSAPLPTPVPPVSVRPCVLPLAPVPRPWPPVPLPPRFAGAAGRVAASRRAARGVAAGGGAAVGFKTRVAHSADRRFAIGAIAGDAAEGRVGCHSALFDQCGFGPGRRPSVDVSPPVTWPADRRAAIGRPRGGVAADRVAAQARAAGSVAAMIVAAGGVAAGIAAVDGAGIRGSIGVVAAVGRPVGRRAVAAVRGDCDLVERDVDRLAIAGRGRKRRCNMRRTGDADPNKA